MIKSLFKRNNSIVEFVPERKISFFQWFEVALIPLIAVAIAWLASPGDPMLTQRVFPWLWFAPLLIALRYGVLPGLLACLPLLFSGLLADQLGLFNRDLSVEYFSGGGLIILLCGEFSDVWRDRNLRMEESSLYATERLSRLTKRHLLLNLSHDRLEQEMLARPGSLRDALARLRTIALESGAPSKTMPGASGLLQLLAQYVNIESAAIYGLKEKEADLSLDQALVKIGHPEPLTAQDALLAIALETRNLAHVAGQDVSQEHPSNQLVVAPMISGNDTLIGVLVVTRMPFFSLNVENLQMMSVILAYYADNIRHAPQVHAIQLRMPTIPALYAEELVRMTLIRRKTGIDSHIVVLRFSGSKGTDIVTEFLRIKRGLDLYWQTYIGGHPVIAVLMPFASLAAKDGFLYRVEDWLTHRFGGNFESLQIYLHTLNFSRDDPLQELEKAMQDNAQ